MSRRSPLPPGIITLCVVFICLCMGLLSLLTYNGARDRLALAQASSANMALVMEADLRCRLRLGQAVDLIDRGEDIQNISLETQAILVDNILVFEEPVDENRVIRAELELAPRLRLIAFRTIYTGQWSPDSSLEIWDGQ